MNENKFECDGKKYESSEPRGLCHGCAFHMDRNLDCKCPVSCIGSARKDGLSVIFVEVQDGRVKG